MPFPPHKVDTKTSSLEYEVSVNWLRRSMIWNMSMSHLIVSSSVLGTGYRNK